jgi:ABC-type multidrug transport system ATPase subunit
MVREMTAVAPSIGTGEGKALILNITGLGRRFGDREVLGSLDAKLHSGERLALTGPNGSGKTTVLRCVSGALAPTKGTISVCGHQSGSIGARRHVGVSLSQERSFFLRLTGKGNLLFFARLRHRRERDARRAVGNVVQELELDEIAAQRVDRCSTGMVQQLALARALIGDPVLLLLDEPTRSMDPEAIKRLWGAIGRRPYAAVVIATHRSEDVNQCHGRIALTS